MSTEFILKTDPDFTPGGYSNLSVLTCDECCALVPEDMMSTHLASHPHGRFDFPRALATFLARNDVYRELQKATTDPLALREALLQQAWALEPNDPADGTPLPTRRVDEDDTTYVYCAGTASYDHRVSLPDGVFSTLEAAMASVDLRPGETWAHDPASPDWWEVRRPSGDHDELIQRFELSR